MIRRPPRSTLFSLHDALPISHALHMGVPWTAGFLVLVVVSLGAAIPGPPGAVGVFHVLTVLALSDRKSTRLNSSHANISYAVFCLKKKNNIMLALLHDLAGG